MPAAVATPQRSRARELLRLALLTLLTGAGVTMLFACAASPPRAVRIARAAASAPADARVPADAGPPPDSAGDDVPSFDALATRAATEAPLMRETLRVEDVRTSSPELKVGPSDACFRAVVGTSATEPVRVWFEDADHAPRGEVGAAGLVPPRGPACARRGEVLRLVVAGSSSRATVRAVVLQSTP
jgi:hypothetical protein